MNKTATNLKKNDKAPATKKEEKIKKSDVKNDSKVNDKKAAKKSADEKDNPKAKRGRSGFIIWGIDNRARIIKENPGIKPKDIMTELGKQWKDVNSSIKDKYTELAKQESDKLKKEREVADKKDGGKRKHSESKNESKI